MSYKIGIVKPQKGIFEHALKELKLSASECVFIDDDEKNITAAKSLGFKAIHFKNNKQLAEDLELLGIAV